MRAYTRLAAVGAVFDQMAKEAATEATTSGVVVGVLVNTVATHVGRLLGVFRV